MNEALTTESVMYGHVSEETAFLVDDYPYGYTLRTQIRYWIETNAKRGDRFVSQTLNPKTGKWNKPKKSTYSEVMVMFLDEKGHVSHASVHTYSNDEDLAAFRTLTERNLSDEQKGQLAFLLSVRKVMKDVTFSVRTGPQTDEERQEQARIGRVIEHRVQKTAAETLGELR